MIEDRWKSLLTQLTSIGVFGLSSEPLKRIQST